MTSISAQWPKTPDQPLRIYRTTPPAVTEWSTGDLAAQLGLRAGRHGTTRTTADKVTIADGHSEVTVYRDSGALRYRNRTRWQLDHGGNLDLGDDDAAGIARAFVERYDLAPLAECRLAKVTRLRVGLADREGTTAEERVIDVGVIFRRAIDGLATDGPGGNVMVYIGADGEPTGVDRIWRGIADVDREVDSLQPPDWLDQRVGSLRDPDERTELLIQEVRFGYFEQGWRTRQDYLQPAYVVLAELRSSNERMRRRVVHAAPAATNHVGELVPQGKQPRPQSRRTERDATGAEPG